MRIDTDAWRDRSRKCPACGSLFIPEEREQDCCDASCEHEYWGFPEPYEPPEDEDF